MLPFALLAAAVVLLAVSNALMARRILQLQAEVRRHCDDIGMLTANVNMLKIVLFTAARVAAEPARSELS